MKGINFIPFDLNEDFSKLGKFDAIIALEIIEHIENQFHFIRCIKKLLSDKGILFLSTPNVESTFSRAKFYFFGRLHFFSKEPLACPTKPIVGRSFLEIVSNSSFITI